MPENGLATYDDRDDGKKAPKRKDLPTPFVQGFRIKLAEAFDAIDPASGLALRHCIGVYLFYDYDDQPIYVGQTTENFGTRVGRHLTGQRTDTVAYRILDPFEVAKIRLYPTQHFTALSAADKKYSVDQLEYSVYIDAIKRSKYKAILNEKIPNPRPLTDLPPSQVFDLIPEELRADRDHPDVRIARRADTLARLAAVAHERGEVTPGLRRVIVLQALRLVDIGSARLAYAEGRRRTPISAINIEALVGSVLREFSEKPDKNEPAEPVVIEDE